MVPSISAELQSAYVGIFIVDYKVCISHVFLLPSYSDT